MRVHEQFIVKEGVNRGINSYKRGSFSYRCLRKGHTIIMKVRSIKNEGWLIKSKGSCIKNQR